MFNCRLGDMYKLLAFLFQMIGNASAVLALKVTAAY